MAVSISICCILRRATHSQFKIRLKWNPKQCKVTSTWAKETTLSLFALHAIYYFSFLLWICFLSFALFIDATIAKAIKTKTNWMKSNLIRDTHITINLLFIGIKSVIPKNIASIVCVDLDFNGAMPLIFPSMKYYSRILRLFCHSTRILISSNLMKEKTWMRTVELLHANLMFFS